MLFTGDACYTGDHWCDKCLPGLVSSSSDAAESVKKLRRVAKEHDAKVVWGHDPVAWLRVGGAGWLCPPQAKSRLMHVANLV
jgi:glyoxylase-like metal-dependent hydrolase (beta-lactamase superfamily II)